MTGADDWEDDLLDKLETMFANMGMPMDREQLRQLMRKFKQQFDAMGLDPEKLAKGDVNFNFDLSEITKMLSTGSSIDDLLKNFGVDVKVDATPVEINPEAISDSEPIVNLPSEDVYLDGWNMSVTLDFTLKGDLEPEHLEIELIKRGTQIEILKATQPAPLALVQLPHPCDDVVDWSLNNGILDITLKLTPQGKALELEMGDDETPRSEHVSVELSDEEEDDDDDDGGIPIF